MTENMDETQVEARTERLRQERDEAVAQALDLAAQYATKLQTEREAHMATMGERDDLRATVERLHVALGTNDGGQGAVLVEAATKLRVEADKVQGLEERIQALEGTLATEEAERVRCRDGWAKAESRIAAIRQRVRNELHGQALEYVLGADGPETVEGVSNSPSNSEPTTAELVAMARTRGTEASSVAGECALSLLEHRMGVMVQLLRDITSAPAKSWTVRMIRDVQGRANAIITDATPSWRCAMGLEACTEGDPCMVCESVPDPKTSESTEAEAMTDDEARRICVSAGVDVEAGLADAMALVHAAQQSEPSTVEVFAGLRLWFEMYAKHGTLVDGPLRDVALLEHRMGAMERVIAKEADGLERAGLHGFAGRLRAALTGAPEAVEGAHKPGANAEPAPCGTCPGCTDENWADGDLCDAATVRDMERTDYKAPPALDVAPTPAPPPEPTTAEAFATARLYVVGDGVQALSMLERRMGALERAARNVTRDGNGWLPGFDELRAALTGAPPVFTLEEIERAVKSAGVGPATARVVRQELEGRKS